MLSFFKLLQIRKEKIVKAIIQEKINEVEALVKDFKDAKSILAFEYHTIPAKTITELRCKLHKNNAKMYVAKNNIFNRAFKLANITSFGELSGPNAIIIAHGDEIIPFKEIHKLMDNFKQVVYKNGILDKETILPEQLTQIANIPSRNGLYSMFLSCLQGLIRNFLYGLKSIGEKKPQ